MVERAAGTSEAAWDEEKGRLTLAAATPIYSGKALVSSKGWMPQALLEGGAPTKMMHYRVLVPLGSAEFMPMDLVTVQSSPKNRDAALIGQQFYVDQRNFASAAVAMAYFVNDYDTVSPR